VVDNFEINIYGDNSYGQENEASTWEAIIEQFGEVATKLPRIA
jgi:hypothetical protein